MRYGVVRYADRRGDYYVVIDYRRCGKIVYESRSRAKAHGAADELNGMKDSTS